MKILLYICRALVGATFIVSGIIKANDPLGFSYKLLEYFEESALNLPFLEPYALLLAILASTAEIILGFAVLFGGKMKLASWSLLILTVFFGWLTIYTATCNSNDTYTTIIDGKEVTSNVTCVTDCGCFGDAMKGSVGRSLTPWESFYKDLVLFILLLPIFVKRSSIEFNGLRDDVRILSAALVVIGFYCWVFGWLFPLWFTLIAFTGYFILKTVIQTAYSEWSVAVFVAFLASFIIYITYNYLPLKDYRPYAIGKNIIEGLKSCDELELPCPEYASIYLMKNKTTGEEFQMNSKEYMEKKVWEDQNLEMIKALDQIITLKEGYEAPIRDFEIQDADYTQELLNSDKPLLLLVAYDISKTNTHSISTINEIANYANDNEMNFVALSASSYEEVENFRHEHQTMFDFYTSDQVTLKTIIRSNPGLLLIKKGVVIGKWHHNKLPDLSELKSLAI